MNARHVHEAEKSASCMAQKTEKSLQRSSITAMRLNDDPLPFEATPCFFEASFHFKAKPATPGRPCTRR
jgi:hypothetical protein